MKHEGEKLANEIEIEDVGKLKEFVGCKIEIDNSEQSTKFTQPVTIQSFMDEFSSGRKKQVTPAEPNAVLKRPEPGKILANKDQSKYQSGLKKMMNMMRWMVKVGHITCDSRLCKAYDSCRENSLQCYVMYNGLLCDHFRERVST